MQLSLCLSQQTWTWLWQAAWLASLGMLARLVCPPTGRGRRGLWSALCLVGIFSVLVQESVHDGFVEKLQEAMESQLVLGDLFAEGVSQGPLINKSQYK